MTIKVKLRSFFIISLILISSSIYSATISLVSCIRTTPLALNTNQLYTVIMSVTNTGLTDAPATTPDILYVQLPSTLISGPVPATASIMAGSYQEFTWIYRTTAVTGTGVITGLARSMGDVSTDACGGGNTITVYAPPNLSGLDIFINPSPVSIGQNITITMNVTNTGGSDAVGVSPVMPLTRIGTGTFVLLSGPTPVSQTVSASSNAWFTLIYQATSAGFLCVYDRVSGFTQYSNMVVNSVTATSNCITIQTPASLVCGLNAMPSQASVGQIITLVLSVTNVGQAGAINVCPSVPGIMIPGNATMLSAPSCVTIPGSTVAHFTWTYSAAASGMVSFTASAQGTDANAGYTVATGMCSSNNVLIQVPANLSCATDAYPDPASVGVNITVVMTLTNTGGATVFASVPVFNAFGVSSVYISGPTPFNISITGASSGHFTWVYVPTTVGVFCFSGIANGTDANSGMTISSSGCGKCINVPPAMANLVITCMSISSPVSVGQNLTVVMNVSNTGVNAADNVVPSLTVMGMASSLSYLSGPSPANASIVAGGVQQFTWIYSCVGTGTVSFYEEASGMDAVYSTVVNAVPILCGPVIMQTAANLSCAINTFPNAVNIGQNITVVMTVTNNGQAAALNVTPSPLIKLGTGNVSLLTSPVPVLIPGGSVGYFTWTYSAAASGNVGFNGNASGTDANSGQTVSTSGCMSSMIAIQAPTSLICAISAQPDPVTVGAFITVVMTVTNIGQATAINVLPSVLFQTGTGGAILISGPVPAGPQTLSGGMEVSFTWAYMAAGLGNLCFSGNAQGVDINSGLPVSSDDCGTCLNVIIASPTITETPTQQTTPTPTITACTSAAYAYIQPNQAVCGDSTSYSYRVIASNDCPITEVRIELEAGVIVTGGLTSSIPGAIVSLIGNEIVVSYPAGWNSTSNPNFDMISFDAVSCGCKYYGSYLNGIADARGVTPNGYSQIVCLVSPTFTITPTTTETACCLSTNTPTDISTPTNTPTQTSINTSTSTPTITPAANLICEMSAYPISVPVGGTITVVLAVTNTGTGSANNVVPTLPGMTGIGGATLTAGPSPATASISPSGAVYFTWLYQATASDFVSFSSSASGTDAMSGAAVSTGVCSAAVQVYDVFGSPTFTPTPTPTVTATYCTGEGNIVVNPAQVIAGSSGNTLVFTYTAGPTTWASNASMRITVPTGWSMPELNSSAPGYFTVDVIGGTLNVVSALWPNMRINVSGLPANTGQIVVTYGNKSLGGPGATVQAGCVPDPAVFIIKVNPLGPGNECEIADSPQVHIVCPSPTCTGTATSTNIQSSTPTITPSYNATPTETETLLPTITLTETYIPVNTTTYTYTATPSSTYSIPPTQTVTWPLCCGTPTLTPTTTSTPPQSSTLLSIKKTVGGEPPAVGALITYEIEITNTDTKPAYNIMIWDTLPNAVEFLYNYSTVPCVISGKYLIWDLSAEPAASPLNPGNSIYIKFDCKIISLSNTAPISNFAGCDYDDTAGKHAPIFSQLAFYPLNLPAVYPNPGADYIKFTNIVPGSQIEIYTLSGEFVNSMDVQEIVETWDCRNRYRMRVSPGIYYYLIRDAKGKMQYRGKLFLIHH